MLVKFSTQREAVLAAEGAPSELGMRFCADTTGGKRLIWPPTPRPGLEGAPRLPDIVDAPSADADDAVEAQDVPGAYVLPDGSVIGPWSPGWDADKAFAAEVVQEVASSLGEALEEDEGRFAEADIEPPEADSRSSLDEIVPDDEGDIAPTERDFDEPPVDEG